MDGYEVQVEGFIVQQRTGKSIGGDVRENLQVLQEKMNMSYMNVIYKLQNKNTRATDKRKTITKFQWNSILQKMVILMKTSYLLRLHIKLSL